MVQCIIQLEANIKREVTRIYKSTFGKGPEKTSVKAFENIILVIIDGGLTILEQNLMSSDQGEKIVHEIRNELFGRLEKLFLIQEIVNSKLLDVNYFIEETNNKIYLCLIFENDIETN